MIYNAKDIARYVLVYYERHNTGCSNLKLQKVLYFLQAEFLVTKRKRLFREPIIAWDFGPVVKEVYEEYKMFGSGTIPIAYMTSPFIELEDLQILDTMLTELQDYSSATLTNITLHQSPWRQNYNRERENEIPIQDIYNFFKES